MSAATEIRQAKAAAGSEAYLWAHTSGDVILWESEAQSVGDDGARAVGRWQVDAATLDELADAIDELA